MQPSSQTDMALWNDKRTPPGVMTDLSVQMGAQYSAPVDKPDPAAHRAAKSGTKPTKAKPTARHGK